MSTGHRWKLEKKIIFFNFCFKFRQIKDNLKLETVLSSGGRKEILYLICTLFNCKLANFVEKMFTKELCCMMYGFGDDINPNSETVKIMEDLIMVFICEIITKANKHRRKERLTIKDLIFVLRRDPIKLWRVHNLIKMNFKLKKARKAFNPQLLEKNKPLPTTMDTDKTSIIEFEEPQFKKSKTN